MTRCAAAIAVSLALASSAYADWSDCASDLEDMRRATTDAQEAAEQAASAAEDLESESEDLRQCISYPEVYDLMSDGCQMKRSDVESAESELEDEQANLAGYLETLRSKASDVNFSCEVHLEVTAEVHTTSPRQSSLCPAIKALALRVPAEKLSAFCAEALSLNECLRCL